jgi:hypothetical protein
MSKIKEMKKLIILLILCFSVSIVNAQVIYNSSGRKVAKKPVKKSGFDRDKLVLGGDFRFAFGQGVNVGVAPMVGYRLAKNFFAGVRIGYSFYRYKEQFNGLLPNGESYYVFKDNTLSGGIWARYIVWQGIYLHAEGEYNSFKTWDGTWDYNKGDLRNQKIQSPSVLVGIGFKQPISDRTSFNTTILFDALNDPNSYYAGVNGVDLRFGIMVGF